MISPQIWGIPLGLPLLVAVAFYLSACASTPTVTNPSLKPEWANANSRPRGYQETEIKDKTLRYLYDQMRDFEATSWENREEQLFKMVNNRISYQSVLDMNSLMDLPQLNVVQSYLGALPGQQTLRCNWNHPTNNTQIHYIRGGICSRGSLNGVVEFSKTIGSTNQPLWALMQNGSPVRIVLGQRSDKAQAKPVAFGTSDRNFTLSGMAALQTSATRTVGEFIAGAPQGWGAQIGTRKVKANHDSPVTEGRYILYVGQLEAGKWSGFGVSVLESEFYLSPHSQMWVPSEFRVSFGWKQSGNQELANGPTLKFTSTYKSKYSYNFERSYAYYGYYQNGDLNGLGYYEDWYPAGFGDIYTFTEVGQYQNSKKVGTHIGYKNAERDSFRDECYSDCGSSSGFGVEQALAIAGGAVLAGSSNLSSAQKVEFMSAYSTDVLNDTGGSNIQNFSGSGSAMGDLDDPLNPNNPINQKMQAQSMTALRNHDQEQDRKKQDYQAQLNQRNQEIAAQRAASLKRRQLQFEQSGSGASQSGNSDECRGRTTIDPECGDKVTNHDISWTGRAYTDGSNATNNTPSHGDSNSHSDSIPSRYAGLSFSPGNSENTPGTSRTPSGNTTSQNGGASNNPSTSRSGGGGRQMSKVILRYLQDNPVAGIWTGLPIFVNDDEVPIWKAINGFSGIVGGLLCEQQGNLTYLRYQIKNEYIESEGVKLTMDAKLHSEKGVTDNSSHSHYIRPNQILEFKNGYVKDLSCDHAFTASLKITSLGFKEDGYRFVDVE